MTRRAAVRLPKPFTAEEFRTLLEAAPADVGALLVFARETGLRAAEALSITSDEARTWHLPPWYCRKSVCPKHSASTRIIGKGDKERPVILTRSAVVASRVLLASSTNGHLIPWERRTMQRRLEVLSATTGIHVHLHRCRHSLLSELVESGVPIEVVADVAGHSNIQVTRRYWFASERARRGALARRGRWLRRTR